MLGLKLIHVSKGATGQPVPVSVFITRFIIADIKYTTTSTGVGYGSGFELTKDTPYLALTDELWDVFVSILMKNDRVIKGFYCIYIYILLLHVCYG